MADELSPDPFNDDSSESDDSLPDLDSDLDGVFPELDVPDESLPTLDLEDDPFAEAETEALSPARDSGAGVAAAAAALGAGSAAASASASAGADDAEDARIREVTSRGFFGRMAGYAKMSGPGFLQSAITLGAATATSSFYLGWQFGYEMIWVQVLGMFMGVIMFAAVARPTLCRKESIYVAMGRYVHPLVAVAWAVASIAGSIVWCLSQYSTAVACLEDVGKAFAWVPEDGSDAVKWCIGGVVLAGSIPLTLMYGSKGRGIRIYETTLKCAIAFMVACFAIVAWKSGIDWGALGRGILPNAESLKKVADLERADLTKVLGALGCAVGINMTFLFPITLRSRGWRKRHLGLARFDLLFGMFIPFAIISTLVVIASANLLHGGEAPGAPTAVAKLMEPVFGSSFGRIVFDLGVAAMPLSTITILMLISGLAFREMMTVSHAGFGRGGALKGRAWFIVGALLPTLGILGTTYKTPLWLGPLISSFALVLLPIAYFGFFMLHNSRKFLGADMASGFRRLLWNAAMVCILIVTVAGASLKLYDTAKTNLFPEDEAAAAEAEPAPADSADPEPAPAEDK